MGTSRVGGLRRLAGRPATTALAVVSAAVVVAYLFGPGPLRQVMLLTSSTVAVLTVGSGVWLNRLTDRLPWTLAAVGLTALPGPRSVRRSRCGCCSPRSCAPSAA